MRKYLLNRNLLIAGFSIILFFVFHNALAAENAEQLILDKISSIENSISIWDRNIFIIGLIAISIAVSGAVISVAQASARKYTKIITVILGVTVASLVAVKENFYSESRAELNKKITFAKKAIDQVRVKLEFKSEVSDELKYYLGLQKELSNISTASNENNNFKNIFITKAYAKDSPNWKNTSEDKINYYFIGQAASKSFPTAEKLATKLAQKSAIDHYTKYLIQTKKMKPEQVSKIDFIDLLKGRLKNDDLHVEKSKNKVKITVRLKINKNMDKETKKIISTYIKQTAPL